MDLALFKFNGLLFILRYGHFLAGFAWIGMLWYFNFVQGSYFKEAADSAKSDATQKLVPRALWWFRWGAMFTFITGLLLILATVYQARTARILTGTWGVTILSGGLMGIVMWANVWFVIWPAQKLIIASSRGESVGDVTGWARKAFLASRTNTLLSIPMLFFMGAPRHLPVQVDQTMVTSYLLVIAGLIMLVEMSALTGNKSLTTEPIEDVRGVITSGILFSVIGYFVLELMMTMGRLGGGSSGLRTALLILVAIVVVGIVGAVLYDSFKENVLRGVTTLLAPLHLIGLLYLSMHLVTRPTTANLSSSASGATIVLLCGFILGIVTVIVATRGFTENLKEGLLCSLLPLYGIYYASKSFEGDERKLVLGFYGGSAGLYGLLYALLL